MRHSKSGTKYNLIEHRQSRCGQICVALSPAGVQFSSAVQISNTKWYHIRVLWSFMLYLSTSVAVGLIFKHWPDAKHDHPPRDHSEQQNYHGTWFTWAPPDIDYSNLDDFWNSFLVSFPVAALIAFCAPLTPLRMPVSNDKNSYAAVFCSFVRINDLQSNKATPLGVCQSVWVASIIFVTSAILTLPFYNLIGKHYPGGEFPDSAIWAIATFVGICTLVLAPCYYMGSALQKHDDDDDEFKEKQQLPNIHKFVFCQLFSFLASAVALFGLSITCIMFIEWCVHHNVKGSVFCICDLDTKGTFDPHHWQYGVLLSCIYVFAPASRSNTPQPCCLSCNTFISAALVFLSWALITCKGVVFGVYLQGLWSYGPDPIMREKAGVRGEWGAGYVWIACAVFVCCASYELRLHRYVHVPKPSCLST